MYDLILLHAPSIYDFRKKEYNGGPISDVVPSTPIFEMYLLDHISFFSNLIQHVIKKVKLFTFNKSL